MDVEEFQLIYESIQGDKLKRNEYEVVDDDSDQIFISPLCEYNIISTCIFSQTLRPLHEYFDSVEGEEFVEESLEQPYEEDVDRKLECENDQIVFLLST